MSEVASQDHMLEETGKVIAADGAYVLVETRQRTACSQCHVGDSCGTSVLAAFFGSRKNTVRLRNHLKLSVGDVVVLGLNESVLLSMAFKAYVLPLLVMIVFAVSSTLVGMADIINFACSVLGLTLGMVLSHYVSVTNGSPDRAIVLLRNADEMPVKVQEIQKFKAGGDTE